MFCWRAVEGKNENVCVLRVCVCVCVCVSTRKGEPPRDWVLRDITVHGHAHALYCCENDVPGIAVLSALCEGYSYRYPIDFLSLVM